MTSIGYTSAINGANVAFAAFAANKKYHGGAIPGWMPQPGQKVDRRYTEFEQIRFTLKNSWNTLIPSQLKEDKLKRAMVTPFRAVNNAGDLLCRDNYSCGGPCQSFQSRPNMRGLHFRFGGTSKLCIPANYYNSLQLLKNIPSATCNVKYVYDSSDYTRYLKQKAVNLNYNDLTFGGDQSNASQVALKAARRF
jgi:hypothetical protein